MQASLSVPGLVKTGKFDLVLSFSFVPLLFKCLSFSHTAEFFLHLFLPRLREIGREACSFLCCCLAQRHSKVSSCLLVQVTDFVAMIVLVEVLRCCLGCYALRPESLETEATNLELVLPFLICAHT